MTARAPVADGEGGARGDLVLGVDLGTTGAKALLVDVATGRPAGRGYRAYPSATSADGGHEQAPEDWWDATAGAVREAVGSSGRRVRAVGLSGHMHAVVLVDEASRCVRPAITWADRRSGPQVRRLRGSVDAFTAACANPVVEAFTAPKLAWLAEHEPESIRRAVRLVQPKDVLRHRLTGTWGTDTTDACGTLLYDVHRRQWDPSLWRLCGVDRPMGPTVSSSAEVVGGVTEAAAVELGLPPGTPVVAGAGDVSTSALGAGAVAPGTVYVNAGTAAQVTTPLDEPVPGHHFVFGRAASDGFLAMASVYAVGMSVDWVARSLLAGALGGSASAGSRLDEMAADEPAGSSGAVYVPHLLGTSVPTHDPRVRGAFLGLTVDHRPSTLARAVLEGVAFACAAAVAHVGPLAEDVTRVRIGGGLSGSSVWAETLAAVHDLPVERVAADASPTGAAMLAGMGLGVWGDAEEAARVCVDVQPVELPAAETVQRYRAAQHRYEVGVEALTEMGRRTDADLRVPARAGGAEAAVEVGA
ncbi:xylulokinase [Geodermatophilus maliterrae]|uniref:Xylulokinase n=1 Tax=Geodermatophilus maliterrae TaxID=3162531 RepID=A0ABV3XDK4_9ACTN